MSSATPFQQLAESLRGTLDVQNRALTSAMRLSVPDTGSWRTASAAFSADIAQLRASLQQSFFPSEESLQRFLASVPRLEPDNFSTLSMEEEYRLVQMALVHRFGCLEALPPDVIRELLGISSTGPGQATVMEVLARRGREITAQCARALDALVEGDVDTDLASLARKAADALQGGHEEAAQALATAVWDTFLTSRSDKFQKRIGANWGGPKHELSEDDTLVTFYWKAWLGPASAANTHHRLSHDYSRNGTIHHASQTRYGLPHAIQALTIATSLLCYRRVPSYLN